MIIVIPYPSFVQSARVIETTRLMQLIDTIDDLLDPKIPLHYKETEVFRRWKDFPNALADYGNQISKELLKRGNKYPFDDPFPFKLTRIPYALPPWFGDERLHKQHREFLYHRNPQYYGKYWKSELKIAPTAVSWPKNSPSVRSLL